MNVWEGIRVSGRSLQRRRRDRPIHPVAQAGSRTALFIEYSLLGSKAEFTVNGG